MKKTFLSLSVLLAMTLNGSIVGMYDPGFNCRWQCIAKKCPLLFKQPTCMESQEVRNCQAQCPSSSNAQEKDLEMLLGQTPGNRSLNK